MFLVAQHPFDCSVLLNGRGWWNSVGASWLESAMCDMVRIESDSLKRLSVTSRQRRRIPPSCRSGSCCFLYKLSNKMSTTMQYINLGRSGLKVGSGEEATADIRCHDSYSAA